jgi:uncharacterized membrane protein YbaN (DUF454 family)
MPDRSEPALPPEPPTQRNLFYLVVAYLATGLGIVGAFLPVLPTTPFLLLAAWSAAKGSPALHHWLYTHPRFGSALIAWERNGAVSVPAKSVACVFMTFSWLLMLWQTSGWLVPALTGVLFVCVAAFLLTRPSS